MAPTAPPARIEKLVLFTGFSCSSRCHFCIDLNKRDLPDKTAQQIIREMAAARAKGVSYLELIGGETTMRPDFLALLAAARKLGFSEIVVVTNGRMFCYEDFAEKTVAAGVTELVFSIHGHNAALHDAMTAVPGAFDQLIKGIENVRRFGLRRVFANCTVTAQNMRSLPEIGRLFLRLGLMDAEFIFVDPNYGGAYSQFEALVPRISDAAPYMREVLDVGRAGGTRNWTVRYVPLCHFEDYLDQISEIRELKTFRTRHWAPDFKNDDVGATRSEFGRIKPAACAPCRLYDRCEGLWREYALRRGVDELKVVL